MKTKRTGLSYLALVVMCLCMLFANPVSAFAAVTDTTATYISNIITSGKGLPASLREHFTEVDAPNNTATAPEGMLLLKVGNNTVYYDNKAYAYKDSDSKRIDTTVKNLIDVDNAGQRVDDMMGNLDIGADVEGAAGMVSGLTGFVSLITGFLVMAFIAFMVFFTVIDIGYIQFPIIRNMLDGGGEGGKGKSLGQFVTDDAKYCVKQKETGGKDGGHPMARYLWRRSLSYVLLVIAIYILLTGNIGFIAKLALQAVSGVLDIFAGF